MVNKQLKIQFHGGGHPKAQYGQDPLLSIEATRGKELIQRLAKQGYSVSWSTTGRLTDPRIQAKVGQAAYGERVPRAVAPTPIPTPVTEDLIAKGIDCGKLAKEVGKILKGGGGGRPDFAQLGGSDPGTMPDAIDFARKQITAILNK